MTDLQKKLLAIYILEKTGGLRKQAGVASFLSNVFASWVKGNPSKVYYGGGISEPIKNNMLINPTPYKAKWRAFGSNPNVWLYRKAPGLIDKRNKNILG